MKNNIRKLRVEKGIKPFAFAKQVDITYQALYRWETGVNVSGHLTWDLISRICKVLNVRAEDLFTE